MSVSKTRELGAWSSTETGEPFGEWELPGMGNPSPRCGEVSATAFCDEHGHIEYEKHQCGRRECPDCWSHQWAKHRTVSVVSRLASARYSEPDGIDRRAVHAVASPPEDDVNTIEAFYSGRREALDIARDHGIRGGVVVAHGYRVLEEARTEYREKDRDIGIWRWIRENENHWKEQVYWSPHFHIIGLARDVAPGDLDRDGGWIFENIRSLASYDGPRDREGTDDMISVVRYLLSHSTFPAGENRQAVTWFGSLHGTNFSPDEELSEVDLKVIQRVVKRQVGYFDDEGEKEGNEREDCPRDGCEGSLHDIWHARRFLETSGHSLEREERERVVAAYEWTVGLRHPPPGRKHPKSREQAEEALSSLV